MKEGTLTLLQRKKMVAMSVQPYDTVLFHNEKCMVEQVWEDHGKQYCALRELEHPEHHGMFFANSAELQPTK